MYVLDDNESLISYCEQRLLWAPISASRAISAVAELAPSWYWDVKTYTDERSVGKYERQLSIVFEIIVDWTDLLVSEPCFQTVERH